MPGVASRLHVNLGDGNVQYIDDAETDLRAPSRSPSCSHTNRSSELDALPSKV